MLDLLAFTLNSYETHSSYSRYLFLIVWKQISVNDAK